MTSTEATRANWRSFAVAVAVSALTILDLTKVNVGLPSIEHSLNARSSDLQLIVAGYALAFGLALVPAGRLGDIHSRKLLFIIGLSGFVVASIVCALAPGVWALVLGRVLQGLSAGTLMPQVLGLIQQLFVGPARGRAFGMFGATVGVATAFAPTLGGLLIAIGGDESGWRLLFWMNVPLGIAALVLAIRWLPSKSLTPPATKNLDLIGVALLGLATFGLLVPFITTTGASTDNPHRWWWLALAAGSAFGFALWERRYTRRGKSPIVHFALFTSRSYRNGLLVGAVYFAALPAVFLISTLFLQQGLGLAPFFAGLVSIPFALTSAVTAYLGGRLVGRFGRKLVVFGISVVIIGYVLDVAAAELMPPASAPYWMAAALFIGGVGGGFVIAPNQTLTLAQVPVSEAGTAGSMAQLGQRIGTSIGTAAASAVFFSTVLRESGSDGALDGFRHGFRNGVAIAVGFMVVALAVAIVDLVQRRTDPAPSGARMQT